MRARPFVDKPQGQARGLFDVFRLIAFIRREWHVHHPLCEGQLQQVL